MPRVHPSPGSLRPGTEPDIDTPARILLVEDDDDIRVLARMIIDLDLYMQHEVFEVTNGYDAIRVCSEVRPHVMVLDLNLPQISGLHVLRAVRATPMAPCVIAWSADPWARQGALNSGADYAYDKGDEVTGLLETIENCLLTCHPANPSDPWRASAS
ncbi:MAG: response regulator [Actinomycetes bacterium]